MSVDVASIPAPVLPAGPEGFTEEQQTYLQGFVAGTGAARVAHGLYPLFGLAAPAVAAAPDDAPGLAGPLAFHREAQDRTVAAGGKLVNEEKAKRAKNPFDMWDEMQANAAAGVFPKGTDVFLYKFSGLFYVAPAQDSFMCRLRLPGGILSAHQLSGIAELAGTLAGGYAHVTTRANLQLRDIRPESTISLLEGIAELGLTSRGAGADNIRNITGSPTAGIDPLELIDTRPLTRELYHHILNHRELFGLPRKFNIAYDGGGSIPVLEETNDIGFSAVRLPEGGPVEPGIWFRFLLGGITGHRDIARDTGVLVRPEDCTALAVAAVRVFIEHGDRTDRRKARLKYVLDRLGLDTFVAETEKEFGRPLTRVSPETVPARATSHTHHHLGFHPQRQPGLCYVGIAIPVGRLSAAQMRGLAEIAGAFGSGSVRLTVWQNLLISDIPETRRDEVRAALGDLGLSWTASAVRAGLIACTGSSGCKFSASDTKRHALAIGDHIDAIMTVDQPVGIHLTGCHHSCAQHLISDIGLLGAKVPQGDGEVEGYHVHVGGGCGAEARIGRELIRDVPAEQVPALVGRMLAAWQMGRASPDESFRDFSARQSDEALIALFHAAAPAAA
ncbi:MAG: NirA family protein [Azospirillum sp.]|nr:NirA family protein [Azospirillum sp.]